MKKFLFGKGGVKKFLVTLIPHTALGIALGQAWDHHATFAVIMLLIHFLTRPLETRR